MGTRLKGGIIGMCLLLASFLMGRATCPSSNTTINDKKQDDIETHTITKTVVVQEPGGPTTTTTTQETNVSNKETDVDITKSVPASHSKINISAMAGLDATNLSKGPVYGISANKELIGPITVGIYGLTNGMFGATVGINF